MVPGLSSEFSLYGPAGTGAMPAFERRRRSAAITAAAEAHAPQRWLSEQLDVL